jgi:hypothetical protein
MSTSIRNHLAGTIEQILSDKVVSEIVINTAAGPGDFDHHNRVGQADESGNRRRRLRRNQSDPSVRREEIIGAELKRYH